MKMSFDPDNVSEELLNAFVDNELDQEERLQLLEAQLKHPALHFRICELRQLKELVSSARPIEKSETTTNYKRCLRLFNPRAIAASVLLLITISLITTFTHHSWEKLGNRYSYSYPELTTVLTNSAATNNTNIVFHINKNNSQSLETLFDNLERLLIDPQVTDKNIRIEVLTSGPGLPLLDTLSDKHHKLITHLYTRHENISFVVCQQTLTKYRDKTKKLTELPKGMVLTASAPELINLRRTQGWTYISI